MDSPFYWRYTTLLMNSFLAHVLFLFSYHRHEAGYFQADTPSHRAACVREQTQRWLLTVVAVSPPSRLSVLVRLGSGVVFLCEQTFLSGGQRKMMP